MNTDIHARSFTLTPALRHAVERRAAELRARLPRTLGGLAVRLFDVNGTRGGPDKGCLVHARLARQGTVVVATDIDVDLYKAIDLAFAKLHRAVRHAIGRNGARRRRTIAGPDGARLRPAMGVALIETSG